jgi:hypothetical protein
MVEQGMGGADERAVATARMVRTHLRRLDWRFLLPNPVSSDGVFRRMVILGGDAPSTEYAELAKDVGLARHVSRSLPEDGSADLVAIFHDARVAPGQLDGAARSLAEGGVLYYEVQRSTSWGATIEPRQVQRRLRQLGLSPAGLYWVKPNFRQCEMYLPLDVEGALSWYFSTLYTAITPQRWLLQASLRLATRLRAPRFAPLAPSFAVIAVAAPPDERTVVPAVLASGALPSELDWAGWRPVMFTDAGERVVLAPFGPRDRRPGAVVKVPKLPSLNPKIEHEQQALGEIRDHAGLTLRDHLPAPLGVNRWHDLAIGVESSVQGKMLLASSGNWAAPVGRKVEDLHLASAWLTRFHTQVEISRSRWGDPEVARWVASPLASYVGAFGDNRRERRLFEAVSARARELGGRFLPLVWQHRDFSVWNVFRDDRQINVIDWEGARVGPPLGDLLYFVAHWGETAARMTTEQARLDAFVARFAGAGDAPLRTGITSEIRRVLTAYMDQLHLDRGFLPVLLVTTWVELALGRYRRQQALGIVPASGPESRRDNMPISYLGALAEHTDQLLLTWPVVTATR